MNFPENPKSYSGENPTGETALDELIEGFSVKTEIRRGDPHLIGEFTRQRESLLNDIAHAELAVSRLKRRQVELRQLVTHFSEYPKSPSTDKPSTRPKARRCIRLVTKGLDEPIIFYPPYFKRIPLVLEALGEDMNVVTEELPEAMNKINKLKVQLETVAQQLEGARNKEREIEVVTPSSELYSSLEVVEEDGEWLNLVGQLRESLQLELEAPQAEALSALQAELTALEEECAVLKGSLVVTQKSVLNEQAIKIRKEEISAEAEASAETHFKRGLALIKDTEKRQLELLASRRGEVEAQIVKLTAEKGEAEKEKCSLNTALNESQARRSGTQELLVRSKAKLKQLLQQQLENLG
jgi:hypothetical protein